MMIRKLRVRFSLLIKTALIMSFIIFFFLITEKIPVIGLSSGNYHLYLPCGNSKKMIYSYTHSYHLIPVWEEYVISPGEEGLWLEKTWFRDTGIGLDYLEGRGKRSFDNLPYFTIKDIHEFYKLLPIRVGRIAKQQIEVNDTRLLLESKFAAGSLVELTCGKIRAYEYIIMLLIGRIL